LSAEEGFAENRGNILVTNGELLVSVHRDALMAYRVLKGRHDVEELLGEEGLRKIRIPSIDSTRFSLIASELQDIPPGWTKVEGRCIVTLTRSDEPHTEAL
jgi:hypothetical protein